MEFTVIKKKRKSTYLAIGDWLNKLESIYTMEYYVMARKEWNSYTCVDKELARIDSI